MIDAEKVHARRWWILVVLCTSLVMVLVGNTVLNIALPTLARLKSDGGLGATSSQLQWMVDAYALVFAGLLLSGGALGDRFGRKGALQIGLVIFGLGSASAALSHSAGQVIFFRGVMGLGAALVMPATLSILTNVFPPEERARAIGIWAGLSAAGAAIGPIAGGWLLEHFWWGSAFFINVPIALGALVAGYVLVPTSKDPVGQRLDPVGAGLSILGLGSLVYGIIEAPGSGWTSATTLLWFGAAVLFLVGFAVWELRNDHPMLDLRYFRNPRFSTSSSAVTLIYFAMFGTFFILTQYLQLVKGYSAFEAGVRTLPFPLMIMAVAPNSPKLVARFGPRRVMSLGLFTVALGLALFSTTGVTTPYWRLIATLLVLPFGMGLTIAPATTSIMSSLPLGKAGVGSAVNDTTRELGGALGVAVLGSLLASQYSSAIHTAIAKLPTANGGLAASGLAGALRVAEQLPGQAGDALSLAAKHAFVDGMALACLVGAAVALVAAGLVFRFLPDTVAVPGEALAPPSGRSHESVAITAGD